VGCTVIASPDAVASSVLQDAGQLSSQFASMLAQGGTLGAMQDITPAERDALYAVAYGMYGQARYEQALPLFAHLVILDHLERRYLLALASTLQVLGRHEEALPHYIAAMVLGFDDPEPAMRTGECLRALEKFAEAQESFELALSLCKAPSHAQVQARCSASLLSLREKYANH
jgi:type III secretion system low calcium response chaperone LcrH/SycD